MLQVDQYPLPDRSELLASLAKGQHFSKLDLTLAYQQILLDDDSAKSVTLSTHKDCTNADGYRLELHPAPAIFQRTMDTILQVISKMVCYLDDMLVPGKSEAVHLQHLKEVLRRL